MNQDTRSFGILKLQRRTAQCSTKGSINEFPRPCTVLNEENTSTDEKFRN